MCVISTSLTVAGVTISAAVANTILATSAVLTVAGIATGITSSVVQGQQQKAQSEYQARVAENNAKIAQSKANQERQQGLEVSRDRKIKTIQQIGMQKAGFASNGIDVTSESALDTIENTAMVGELDSLTAKYNAEQNAIGYEQQAENFNNQANLYKIQGQNAQTNGTLGGISAGLNGASKVANTFSGVILNAPTSGGKL